MFDTETADTLAYIEALTALGNHVEARRLEGLAHYAESHTSIPDSTVPGSARLVRPGGDGTPTVDEFCIDDYAATAGSATSPPAPNSGSCSTSSTGSPASSTGFGPGRSRPGGPAESPTPPPI